MPSQDNETQKAAGKTVTTRALSILSAFEVDRVQLSLSELARRAGLPVSTAHRLVAELVAWGALERIGSDYVIGHRLWKLGLLAPVRRNIAELAAPYMQDVLFVTHNVVNLFVLEHDRTLLVERIAGTRVGVPIRNVGDLLPLHASAAGKVMMAFSDGDLTVQNIPELSRYTANTITDRKLLASEVRKAQTQGFAVSREELGQENYGVAVPVLDHDGKAIAALGVVHRSLPSLGSVVPVLRIAARGIARRLSGPVDER